MEGKYKEGDNKRRVDTSSVIYQESNALCSSSFLLGDDALTSMEIRWNLISKAVFSSNF